MALVLWILCSSLSGFAGKLNFDGRIDAQNQQFNNTAREQAFGHNNFRYLIKTARLDYATDFNEKTSVRARLGFTSSLNASAQIRDGLSPLADIFFIKHKLNDQLDVTLGKFHTDMGGFEHGYSSADVYYVSQAAGGGSKTLDPYTSKIFTALTGKAFSKGSANVGDTAPATWSWDGTGVVRYYTGLKLTYKVSDQELAIHNANLSADDVVNSSNSAQSRTLLGLTYRGNLAEKMIQPFLSYHDTYLPGASSGSHDAKATFSAAAVRVNFEEHIVDIEYLMNQFKDRSLLSSGEITTDSIKTQQIQWRKTYGLWTPLVKIEKAELTAGGTKIFDVTGYNVAVEWRPVSDENFRYHLAYNNRNYAPASSDPAIIQQEFILGMRLLADVLK